MMQDERINPAERVTTSRMFMSRTSIPNAGPAAQPSVDIQRQISRLRHRADFAGNDQRITTGPRAFGRRNREC